MVNASLNWASIVGIVLAVCGAGLYFLRSFKPALARDYDVFFAAIGLLCGGILFFQGWRLDPILQFGQFLLAGTTVFFAYESVRLRGVATDQARRSSYFDDEPELPRPPRGGITGKWGDEEDNYNQFEQAQPISRRFKGREYSDNYPIDETYPSRRVSRAAIPEEAVSRNSLRTRATRNEDFDQENDRRMARFRSSDYSSNKSDFGDRRANRQGMRRGTRPVPTERTSRNMQNEKRPSTSRSQDSDNLGSRSTSRVSSSRKPLANNSPKLEDAAFYNTDSRKIRQRNIDSGSVGKYKKQGSNVKGRYQKSASSKTSPRDNSSRFDD